MPGKRGRKSQTTSCQRVANKKPKQAPHDEPLTPESVEEDETTKIVRRLQRENLPLGLIYDFISPRKDSKYSYPREAAERGDFSSQAHCLEIDWIQEAALEEYDAILMEQVRAHPGEKPQSKEDRKKENKQNKLRAKAEEASRRSRLASETLEADAFMPQNHQVQDLDQRQSDEELQKELEKELEEAFEVADTCGGVELEAKQEEPVDGPEENPLERRDSGYESDISEEE